MAIIKRMGALTAIAVLALALVTPAVAGTDFTVGEFVQRLAHSKGLVASDARIANDALRGVGVQIPSDLSFTNALTEGDVAIISRAAGLNVHTSNPENAFTTEQVGLFFVSFGDKLGGDQGDTPNSHTNPGAGSGPGNGNGGPPFDPFTKGKHGKGKGKGVFTPTEPE